MADEYRNLLNRLLDDGYERAVSDLAGAILDDAESGGRLGSILREIDTEAAKLDTQGQTFADDHPLLTRLESAIDDAADDYARLLNNAAVDIEMQAIDAAQDWFEQSAFMGLSQAEIDAAGITIEVPDPQEILEAVETTQSRAWRDEITAFAAQMSGGALLAKVALDDSPMDVASALRDVVLGGIIAGTDERMNPFLSRTSRLGRTLQMNIFRRADAIQQTENRDIIEKVVRIAALDSRVCLACLALHGTELQIGETVSDHDHGRCTSVVILKGFPRDIPTGQEWLDDLLSQERRGMLSPGDQRILDLLREQQGASMRALEDGAVTLADFIAYYESALWGSQPHQASLINILGEAAEQYYWYNL